MTRKRSEQLLGEALRGMDLEPEPYVYRLPDPKTGAGVSNWKPCDFMVWWVSNLGFQKPARCAWIEAKDVDAVDTFPYADFRPSQLAGILQAHALGLPYLLAVYWRRAKRWTISDAYAVVAWFNARKQVEGERPTSIPRTLLMSNFGIDASPANLGQTLKAVLEVGF